MVPKCDQFRESRGARCPHLPLGQEESSSPWLTQPKQGKDAAHHQIGQTELLLQTGGERRGTMTSEHRPLLMQAVPCCHHKLLEGAGIWAFQSTLRRSGDQGTIFTDGDSTKQNSKCFALVPSQVATAYQVPTGGSAGTSPTH